MTEKLQRTLDRAAAAARVELARAADPAAAALLVLLSQAPCADSETSATLFALAGLQLALAKAFAAAWDARGRAIVETTFKLHALLGQSAAQDYADEKSKAPLPKPYAELLRAMAAEPAWHAAGLRWIDLYNQRLTMHRYSDASQLRSHARIVFLLPLELALPEADKAQLPLLQEAAEDWLAAWDLLHAAQLGVQGWNRIELPAEVRMGGFFGMGDEARPPTDEQITVIAAATCNVAGERLAALKKIDTLPPWLIAGASSLQQAAVAVLNSIAANPRLAQIETLAKITPFIGPNPPAPGLLARLKDLLT